MEKELELQRERIHILIGEKSADRLLLQRATDQIEHLSEDVSALKKAFYTFAVGAVGSAIAFAFTVFALLGPK